MQKWLKIVLNWLKIKIKLPKIKINDKQIQIFFVILGFSSSIYGIWLIWPPVSFILGGIFMLWVFWPRRG
jgi:hypothetical protein